MKIEKARAWRRGYFSPRERRVKILLVVSFWGFLLTKIVECDPFFFDYNSVGFEKKCKKKKKKKKK